MKHFIQITLIVILGAFIVSSCEKDITIDLPSVQDKLVVEGSIVTGEPPTVILTRSNPFFGSTNFNDLDEFYVHDAEIFVTPSTGARTQMVEVCLSFVSDSVGVETTLSIIQGFGFPVTFEDVYAVDTMVPLPMDTVLDTIYDFPDLCIYLLPEVYQILLTGNITPVSILGVPNTTYDLEVYTDDEALTATTTIPELIPIDSLSSKINTDDTTASVRLNITVPNETDRYIRYSTSVNGGPFYLPEFTGSVFDNGLFAGSESIALPVERGFGPDEDDDIDNLNRFDRGDTVSVLWQNIDQGTYEFWFTVENDGGDTPFSSPVNIESNIEGGGLGIWGGYANSTTTIIVP